MEREYFPTLMKTYLSSHRKQRTNFEILTLEIILDKMKILLMGLYKPPSFNEKDFLFHVNNAYTFLCTTYENIALIGDFNMLLENQKLNDFCQMNKHLTLKPTCFKGLLPSTIVLWGRMCSKTVFYRCYKNFDQDSFDETLKIRISLPNLSFETFFEIFQTTLDSFGP